MSSMYRNLLLIVVFIIIVGGIWYFFSGSANTGISMQNVSTTTSSTTTDMTDTTGTQTGAGTQTTTVPETVGVGSLQDLIAMNTNLTCSVNLPTVGMARSGTVYVSSGLLRADFFSTTGSKSEIASMIDNGTSLYLWTDGSSQGIQLSAPVSASDLNIAENGGINPSTSLHYICHPWAVNAAFFVPPSSVTFSTNAS